MPQAKLTELSGSSRLAIGFFNSLIRRIEGTKPIAGSGITITEAPDGMIINSSGGGGAGGIPSGFSQITLNVCRNGNPGQLVVIGKYIS